MDRWLGRCRLNCSVISTHIQTTYSLRWRFEHMRGHARRDSQTRTTAITSMFLSNSSKRTKTRAITAQQTAFPCTDCLKNLSCITGTAPWSIIGRRPVWNWCLGETAARKVFCHQNLVFTSINLYFFVSKSSLEEMERKGEPCSNMLMQSS